MDELLDSVRKNDGQAAIYLKNGIRIVGKIIRYDESDLLVSSASSGSAGLAINRSAVATVQPYSQQSQTFNPPNREPQQMKK